MIGVLNKMLLKFIRNGVSEDLPDREAGQVMIQNSLTLVSTALLLPFPLVFWYLDMPEGQYLVAFCILPIVHTCIFEFHSLSSVCAFYGCCFGD